MKYLIFLLILTSCVTVKKAKEKLDENPVEAAKYCSEKYPVKDSVVIRDSVLIDSVYIPVDDWWKLDTVYLKGDSIKLDKICPPTKVVTKVIRHDSTIYRENTAKVSLFQNLYFTTQDSLKFKTSQYNDLKEKWKGKVGIPWWWLLVIGAVVGGFIFLRIKNILSPIKL